MSLDFHKSFLQLIKLGIGTSKDAKISKDIDWKSLKALADEQGLSAVILDALNTDGTNLTDGMSLELKLGWIGEVLQAYEGRCLQYKKAIGSLARFYNQHGFKMMVLKGYSCSLNWPKPEHRPCGDIDIWLFGKQKEADEALEEWLNSSKVQEFKVDKSHHHHTVFNWQGFSVENHYDFVNVHHHKSSAEMESIFKKLGKDDSIYVKVDGEKVYLPSANLHALFLLRHAMVHFAATELILRQLLDWAFFVKAHGKEVDWLWLEGILEEYGMKRLYDVFNAICVGDLGFDVNIFPKVQFEPEVKEKVINEILNPAIPNDIPKTLIPRVFWKYRRWKANEWKHKLVYRESIWSAFLSGVWSHLLKPASI